MEQYAICNVDTYHQLLVECIGDGQWIWEVHHSCRGTVIKARKPIDICSTLREAMITAEKAFCLHVLKGEFSMDVQDQFKWNIFSNSNSDTSIMENQQLRSGGLSGAIKQATEAIAGYPVAGKIRNISRDGFEFSQVQASFLVDSTNRIIDLNDLVADLQTKLANMESDLKLQAEIFQDQKKMFEDQDEKRKKQIVILTDMVNAKSETIEILEKQAVKSQHHIDKLREEINIMRSKARKKSRTGK